MATLSDDQIADIRRTFKREPIELEKKISTLDKPLIIESACPGCQARYWGPRQLFPEEPPGYREGSVRYPAIPVSIEDQVQADVQAIKRGAAALHHHARNPNNAIADTESAEGIQLKAQVYEQVFKDVDAITLEHTWRRNGDGPFDYITHTRHLLELGGGNKYCQGAVIMWRPGVTSPKYPESFQAGITFMEEHGVKPIHKLAGYSSAVEVKRVLIDTGIMRLRPFVLVYKVGNRFYPPLDIDTWMPIELMANIRQIKDLIPDSLIGVYAGGRNWLPITLTAIIAGVDIVRAGVEDCYWMYPHRDEIIKSNTQALEVVVEFANLIGRKVATVEEAREMMGIHLTNRADKS